MISRTAADIQSGISDILNLMGSQRSEKIGMRIFRTSNLMVLLIFAVLEKIYFALKARIIVK